MPGLQTYGEAERMIGFGGRSKKEDTTQDPTLYIEAAKIKRAPDNSIQIGCWQGHQLFASLSFFL